MSEIIQKVQKVGGVTKLYEINFNKSTDTFTEQSTYHRYLCTKAIGSSNVLIDADNIQVVITFTTASNVEGVGDSTSVRLSDLSTSSKSIFVNGDAPAYGQYGYVFTQITITPNQGLTVACAVGESLYSTFEKAKVLIYSTN